MPDKLRFEPQDNLTGQDFSFRKNKEMNAAQTNETIVVDARFNRALGENGEVMGFAKRQFSNTAELLEQREQAFQVIQETYLELLAHPAVQEWKVDHFDLENLVALRGDIPNQVNEARARLETLQQAGAAKEKLDDAQNKLAHQERRLTRHPLVTQDPAAEKQRLQQVARDTPQVAAFIKADEQYKAANSLKTSGEDITESSSHLYENMRLLPLVAPATENELRQGEHYQRTHTARTLAFRLFGCFGAAPPVPQNHQHSARLSLAPAWLSFASRNCVR
jgi:hypothetical protein